MRPEDCCGWHCKTTPECIGHQVGDRVETPFSGQWTQHTVVGRYKRKACQSGIVYEVMPPVPKSSGGRLDAAWFRRPAGGDQQQE